MGVLYTAFSMYQLLEIEGRSEDGLIAAIQIATFDACGSKNPQWGRYAEAPPTEVEPVPKVVHSMLVESALRLSLDQNEIGDRFRAVADKQLKDFGKFAPEFNGEDIWVTIVGEMKILLASQLDTKSKRRIPKAPKLFVEAIE